MSDYIDRQEAIDALIKCGDYYNGNEEAKRGVSQCIGAINDLPSADVVKVGKKYWFKDRYEFATGREGWFEVMRPENIQG